MSIQTELIIFGIYFCSSMTTTFGHAFKAAGPGPGPGSSKRGWTRPGPDLGQSTRDCKIKCKRQSLKSWSNWHGLYHL